MASTGGVEAVSGSGGLRGLLEVVDELVDVIVDFAGVASALWSMGRASIALELAAYAGVALDELLDKIGFRLHASRVSGCLPENVWDFARLLGSLGGGPVGDVVYSAASTLLGEGGDPGVLRDFAAYVGIEGLEGRELATCVLKYVVASLNKLVAAIYSEAH